MQGQQREARRLEKWKAPQWGIHVCLTLKIEARGCKHLTKGMLRFERTLFLGTRCQTLPPIKIRQSIMELRPCNCPLGSAPATVGTKAMPFKPAGPKRTTHWLCQACATIAPFAQLVYLKLEQHSLTKASGICAG